MLIHFYDEMAQLKNRSATVDLKQYLIEAIETELDCEFLFYCANDKAAVCATFESNERTQPAWFCFQSFSNDLLNKTGKNSLRVK